MAAYTEEALAEKLQRLLPTQQSIQSTPIKICIASCLPFIRLSWLSPPSSALSLARAVPWNLSHRLPALSHWIVYHRKRFFKQSVQVWEREILKGAHSPHRF